MPLPLSGLAVVYSHVAGQDNRYANPDRGIPLVARSAAFFARAPSPSFLLKTDQRCPGGLAVFCPLRGSFPGLGKGRARWVRVVAEFGGKNLAEKRKIFRGSTL